jgi:C-terminal processing protease CtpA/Prc
MTSTPFSAYNPKAMLAWTPILIGALAFSPPSTSAPSNSGSDRDPADRHLSPEQVERVRALARQLSDPDWPVRQQATDRLAEFGEPVIGALVPIFRDCDDLETRLRIRRIAQRVFVRARLDEAGAFLGVRQRWTADPREGGGQPGILIAEALPDTAAERAGLRAGDLITGVEGRPIAALGGAQAFSDLIASRKPGSRLVLEVLRDGQTEQVSATLTSRPYRLLDAEDRRRLNVAFGQLWADKFETAVRARGPADLAPH